MFCIINNRACFPESTMEGSLCERMEMGERRKSDEHSTLVRKLDQKREKKMARKMKRYKEIRRQKVKTRRRGRGKSQNDRVEMEMGVRRRKKRERIGRGGEGRERKE